jgi:hypothetical protein
MTVLLTSCLTRLESVVLQLTVFFNLQNRLILTGQTGGCTVILPPIVFPGPITIFEVLTILSSI